MMHLAKLPIIYTGLILATMACQGTSGSEQWGRKDLLEHGVAITIEIPDSATVNVVEWGIQKDVTIVSDSWYNLQLFNGRASTHDRKKLKADLLQTVQQGPYFSEVVLDEDDGFIFSMQIDTVINYDFRHVKIQGDQEYIFQSGMSSTYTKDQIEQLYQIAKEAQ